MVDTHLVIDGDNADHEAGERVDLQTGVLYREDNLTQLGQFPDESVDLIYLDPPFFSNRVYEVIWGDEAEVRSFEDRWAGGIQNYVEWMQERVVELHRILKPTGSLYLHCDRHASHYLKVMLDGVFGMGNFRNEITWKRTYSHGNVARNYGSVADSILFYSRGPKYVWVQQYLAMDDDYVARTFKYKDRDGRRWQSVTLRNPGPRPNLHYPYRASNGVTYQPHRNGWSCDLQRMRRYDAEGRLHFPSKSTGALRLKMYIDESAGVRPSNLWQDIPPIGAQAAERLGYPTQKPLALLERIIATSSEPGDVVLDPFCGCGTTIAAAQSLKRKWIGIDISPTAMEIMRRRLLKLGHQPIIENAPDSIAALKELRPFEFQNWIINAINGTHSVKKVGDMGIDGFWFFTQDPVQVKQSEHVGRNVVDNFESAIRRAGKSTGYVIAFSFTRGAVEEVARVRQDGLDIKLLKVAEVLLHVKGAQNFSKKLGPQPASIAELPLPPVRAARDKPTAEELIESDRQATA